MKAFFDETQRRHDPDHFIAFGEIRDTPEQPARIDELLRGLDKLSIPVSGPADYGIAPLAAAHTPEYLRFLATIHERWREIPGASRDVIPNVHPADRRLCSYPDGPAGLAGYHMADCACPITAATWEAARWSANTVIAATDEVLGGAPAAYALCRPPGHHAFSDLAGGFCYLNNAAVAAERLLADGHRPAIVDIDVHHGNGTQGVFYARGDVLTVSLHADPAVFYPYFWGHAQERGDGPGLGANLNLPLPLGTGDEGVRQALDRACEQVRSYGATVLLVALGLDAYEGDPFQALKVTTPGFARLGEMLAGLALPSVLVQEGGYLSPELGDNLASFLDGFLGAHNPATR